MNRHDLARELPDRQLLERLIDEERLDDFLNRRSPVYKELDLGSRKLSKKEAIDLMLKEPNLIRRPIVIIGRNAVFGYDPDSWDRILR